MARWPITAIDTERASSTSPASAATQKNISASHGIGGMPAGGSESGFRICRPGNLSTPARWFSAKPKSDAGIISSTTRKGISAIDAATKRQCGRRNGQSRRIKVES